MSITHKAPDPFQLWISFGKSLSRNHNNFQRHTSHKDNSFVYYKINLNGNCRECGVFHPKVRKNNNKNKIKTNRNGAQQRFPSAASNRDASNYTFRFRGGKYGTKNRRK